MLFSLLRPPLHAEHATGRYKRNFIFFKIFFRMKDAICAISSCLCLLHPCRLGFVVVANMEPLQLMNFWAWFFDFLFSHGHDSHNSSEWKKFPVAGLFLKVCLAPVLKSCLEEKGWGPQYPKAESWWDPDREGWVVIHPSTWRRLCTSLPDNWTLIYLNLMENHMERNRKLI